MILVAPAALDLAISHAVQTWQPAWLTAIMKAASFIFSPEICVIVSVIILAFLFHRRHYRQAPIVAVLMLGNLLTIMLKIFFSRPRPTTADVHVLAHMTGYSFPSGHALSIALFAAILIVALWHHLAELHRSWLVAILGLIVILVGYSRIYLGVHWFTDVMDGYALALVWGVLTALLFRRRT